MQPTGFGSLLRGFRLSSGLTQEALAERAGLSVRGIADLESGTRRFPYVDTVERLADALHLSHPERVQFAARGRRPAAPARTRTKARAARPALRMPEPATALIGRGQEIASVSALLQRSDVRVLTLVGPGGVGKTRLAMAAAAELSDRFADGVVFVDLTAIRDPALVLPSVAKVLGVGDTPDRALADGLRDALADKDMLLVLDNFEQVLDAATSVADILGARTLIKALITSREPLRLRTEHVYSVPPLAVPDPAQPFTDAAVAQVSAVALFVQRAQAVRPEFCLTPRNAHTIAELCVRLDGLPLAIELAAARARVLPVQVMLARLEQRLDLLGEGPRDQPVRHQTLRAALGWSYDLLRPTEQLLFKRLAVFAGGCFLEAAEAVCSDILLTASDVLEVLCRLVDKSLVAVAETPSGEVRYRLLETVRQFAWEKHDEASESVAMQTRHRDWYVRLAETAGPEMNGPTQAAWLDRVEQEHDNVRAALRWSEERAEVDAGLRMAGSLMRFWEVRGHLSEGRGWLERLLAQTADVSDSTRARALNTAGFLANRQGDYTLAIALHEEGLALFRELGDVEASAMAMHNLAFVLQERGEWDTAEQLYLESLTLSRQAGNKSRTAMSLGNLGNLANGRGDYSTAAALYSESLALRRELGDNRAIALLLNNLGTLANHQAEYERAAAFFEASLAIRLQQSDKRGIGLTLKNLADNARWQGHHDRAASLYRESLALRQEVGDKRGVASCFEGLASLSAAVGDCQGAAYLWGAGEVLRETLRAPLAPVERAALDGDIARARACVDERTFAMAWASGRLAPLHEATTRALSYQAVD